MNVAITGAGSGIGRALALECARRGDALFLCSRGGGRLDETVRLCREAGATVSAARLDVCDGNAVRDWIESADAAAPLDLVVANAGVSTGEETEENVRRTFAVNVDGTVNTVLPAIGVFRRRIASGAPAGCSPQILIVSSTAGYGAVSSCPSYSATKSCLKTWALALRGALRREGISVSAVCPGFVRSRITDRNTCPMPFFMEADEAARRILRGARRRKGVIAFPWPMRLAAWFFSCMPWRVWGFFDSFVPAKVSKK